MTVRRISAFAAAFAISAVAIVMSIRTTDAHDLGETSATLVVREGGHVELRLQIPWSDVLHQRLAPGVPMPEFLARIANEQPQVFARRVASIEEVIARDARLLTSGRTGTRFERWQWPSPAEVQNAIRRELMSRLAEGANFEHASRMSATADVVISREAAARLVLPPILGPALLTVIRPHEEWVRAGEPSTPVTIR